MKLFNTLIKVWSIRLLIICSFLFSSIIATSQTEIFSCGYDEEKEGLLAEDEDYQLKNKAFEAYYQNVVKNNLNQTESSVVHTIPVVVHIVHDNASLGSNANPTDARIQQEIAEATERFRHIHPNAGTYSNPFYGADSEIEFCLAGTDPNGSFTTGIVRHNDNVNNVGTYNDVAAFFNDYYAWDSDNYCNLFIMTTMTNASGVYLGGYDFTIYTSSGFGDRLIGHEIGHYLSLAHTFDGCTNADCTTEGDLVCDTPPKDVSGYNGGTCAAPGNTCTTDEDDTSNNNPYRPVSMGGMGDQVDMLVNYMDYTGGCWDAFTEGQKTRMKANINANRQTLVSNTVCNVAPMLANDAGITFFSHDQENICDGNITVKATLKNYGSNTLSSANIIITLDGNNAFTYSWTGSLLSQEELELFITPQLILSSGNFQISVKTDLPNGVTDANSANDKTFNRTLVFLGGNGCGIYQSCSTYNSNTANGPGNITTVIVSDNFLSANANDQITLCLSNEGDNSFSQEVFNVFDENGNSLGQTDFGTDCGGPIEICINVTVATYNNWIADGTISFDFDPISSSINPNLCATNQACASILLFQNSLPVIPDFYSNERSICANEVIQFIDFSNPTPTNYIWSFFPNTVTFVNGTNANSANPQVQFNSSGLYTVSLNATNANGGDTETKSNYIYVDFVGPEDFESLTYCGFSTYCSGVICPTGLSWENKTNGTDDDTDWRPNSGPTFDSNTGPDFDHNPGTAEGTYLYIESTWCYVHEAHLETNQCFTLPSLGVTELSLWYHMYGTANLGTLHVDVQSGGNWVNDVEPPIVGNQGNVWHNWIIDLSSYAGESIAIRIRGVTTGSFNSNGQSDIAIDDISFNYTALDNYYPDTDNDGYGDSSANPTQVPQGNTPPSGFTLDNSDCDDNNGNIYPGNIEICDGLDNNCNTQTDEGFDMDNDNVVDCFDNCPNDANNNQVDTDGDNYGDVCDCDESNPNDNNITLNNNPIPSGDHYANNSITSMGLVPNSGAAPGFITFQAGETIYLTPGFLAEEGSDFTAKIESCGSSPSPLETLDETEIFGEDIKINDDTAVISESSNVVNINVFPNPFKDNTNITLTLQEAGNMGLTLYNSTGQLQKQLLNYSTLNSGSYNFELKSESLENGLYYLVLHTERETLTRKIIIIK